MTRALREGTLAPDPPEVRAVSLLNYRASASLEEIVLGAVGLGADGSDRRLAWSEVSASGRFSGGLILVLDELSEFLRSKPDRRSFHEDIRFLQFLGEWAQDRRLWVIAAVQEGIEHTGDLEYSMYRKIKDRFPLRFILTPAHVKDLLSGVHPAQEGWIGAAMDALVKDVRECIPRSALNPDDLRAVYPIHPSTLQMLEEVRDRFSLARGIVDFAVTQLRGDSARGIEPYLERPWGSLLTPDAIVDHFRDLFEIQPEFVPLAQQFFPYYRKRVDEIFDTPALRDLAWKLLKVLVLTHLSPSRKGLRPEEAVTSSSTGWRGSTREEHPDHRARPLRPRRGGAIRRLPRRSVLDPARGRRPRGSRGLH